MWSGADFTGARPTEIEDANIILNTVSPVLRRQLDCINVDQWADIAVQNLPNTIPTRLYYEKSFDQTYGFSRILLEEYAPSLPDEARHLLGRIVAGGAENANAAWYYAEPKSAAAEIRDRIAFWKGVQVS